MWCGLVGVEGVLWLRDETGVVVVAVVGDDGRACTKRYDAEKSGEGGDVGVAGRKGVGGGVYFSGKEVGEVGVGRVDECLSVLCAEDGVQGAAGVDGVVVVEDDGAFVPDEDVQVVALTQELDVFGGFAVLRVEELVLGVGPGGDAQGLAVLERVAGEGLAVGVKDEVCGHEPVLCLLMR